MHAPETLELSADVLVIGGGLAGNWAAAAAARASASVILADKGYCGTSGVTATAGPRHWWIPPDPAELRETAIASRRKSGLSLNDPEWMARTLAKTWETLPTLEGLYTFSKDGNGNTQYRALRGPEYMRALRRQSENLGVTILDHCPALELLQRSDGSISGAQGIRRQGGGSWRVNAGAVILASGGTSFLSRLLGSHINTGDGYLMAAEAGADFSGMEFTNYYTVAAKGSTMTRSMSYVFATYYDEDGEIITIPVGPDTARPLAAALLKGRVYCDLHRTPEDIRAKVPIISPNFTLPFRRWGIDPYRQRFEVTLHRESTIRGIGGLRMASRNCETSVPGLYAAGDAATRELVAGAISGGGNINSAWALSSGQWAGEGAARFASCVRTREAGKPIGQAELRPDSAHNVDLRGALAVIQNEMLSYDRNIFRRGDRLQRTISLLDDLWIAVGSHALGGGDYVLRTREMAAMLATDARFASPILSDGLDRVWAGTEAVHRTEWAS